MKVGEAKTLLAHIPEDEQVIGMCRGIREISLWGFFFIGPLIFLANREYIIIATDKHLYLYRIDPMTDDVEQKDVFSYEEITTIHSKRYKRAYRIYIFFENGRSITLRTTRPHAEEECTKLQLSIKMHDFLTLKYAGMEGER